MNNNLLGEELKLPLRIRGEVPLGFEDEHRENPRTRNVVNGPPTSWQCHCLIRALVPHFLHDHGEWIDAFGGHACKEERVVCVASRRVAC